MTGWLRWCQPCCARIPLPAWSLAMVLEPVAHHGSMFRSRRADRLKPLYWDGTGLVMAYKRLEDTTFTWPRSRTG
ncbi:IS66 family insertion sequence element accessory protein TnpB [Paracoccus sp. MA]|uniref:IS66 family insertion sequence element accessory protein TnpB n=1 Tax=Paracoccus sp. MA TaxID=2895796 RepID=UPI00353004ED